MKIISIIIPMYNVAPFIERAIISVYNQDLKEDEFELILIDDGSPDNSAEIAKKITSGRSNVILISQENKGLGGARNTGIKNAKGKFLLFLDADDILLPNALRDLYEKANSLNLDILEFGANGVDANNRVIYTKSVKSESLSGIGYYNNIRYMDSACNKLYNLNFIKMNSLYFLDRIYIEDYEYNTRAFFYAKKVMATPEIASRFYQSPNSITRPGEISSIAKMKKDILFVIERINEFYKIIMPSNQQNLEHEIYFRQRLSFLTATLFYQLFKNNSSFDEFKLLRNEMKAKNIFFVEFKIFNKRKDLFRTLLLKNFILLNLFIVINNFLKK